MDAFIQIDLYLMNKRQHSFTVRDLNFDLLSLLFTLMYIYFLHFVHFHYLCFIFV